MKYFKNGQIVYHHEHNQGVVIDNEYSEEYPVLVRFKNTQRTFTNDGRQYKSERITLSQAPIIEIINEPLDTSIHYMNDEFIPYEQALTLQELGFESPYPIGGYQEGKIFYYENSKLYYDGQPMYSSSTHSGQILAPLYQQAFRWFREKHNLIIQYIPHEIYDDNGQSNLHHKYKISEYDSWRGGRRNTVETELNEKYEEAELECLKKLIELIKNRTNE